MPLLYREGLRKCRYVLKMMSREVPRAGLAMLQLPTAQTGPRKKLQKSYQNIATLTQPLSVRVMVWYSLTSARAAEKITRIVPALESPSVHGAFSVTQVNKI